MRYIGKKIDTQRASRELNEIFGSDPHERHLDLNAPPLVDFTKFIDTDTNQTFYEYLPNFRSVLQEDGKPDVMAPRYGLNHLTEYLRYNMSMSSIFPLKKLC